jgi:hypothetical protein
MYVQTVGTRAQVWHKTARKTSGGLTKNNLMKNKAGRIVSKAKHNTAKREMRLVKYGYGTKKGEFGMVKLGKSRHNKSKKMRKGGSGLIPLTPAEMDDMEILKQSGGGPIGRVVDFIHHKGGSRRKNQSGGDPIGSAVRCVTGRGC